MEQWKIRYEWLSEPVGRELEKLSKATANAPVVNIQSPKIMLPDNRNVSGRAGSRLAGTLVGALASGAAAGITSRKGNMKSKTLRGARSTFNKNVKSIDTSQFETTRFQTSIAPRARVATTITPRGRTETALTSQGPVVTRTEPVKPQRLKTTTGPSVGRVGRVTAAQKKILEQARKGEPVQLFRYQKGKVIESELEGGKEFLTRQTDVKKPFNVIRVGKGEKVVVTPDKGVELESPIVKFEYRTDQINVKAHNLKNAGGQ